MEKKLTKSNDRVIAGVCGGLAEYFEIDISIVRIGYFLLSFFSAGFGILLYIAMAIIIPDKNM